MLSYAAIKHIHILFVVVSILLFEIRFLFKTMSKPIPKILKIIPHINDTLLLVSALTLAFMGGYKPSEHSWLMAKIIALVLYIVFGIMALKSTGAKSMIGFGLATLTFIFMVMTAIYKTPFMIG